ncbi:putative pentatricopeptide repeat-containing protein At1g77010, mitochondrial [Aristolochia californica]|uniref:putative pentatricopeptide repeat-containing protein At1g77010, mitochondrial n=1 Tax=Aristolochia californica TaxID=171875 RepID=UPI0035DC9334
MRLRWSIGLQVQIIKYPFRTSTNPQFLAACSYLTTNDIVPSYGQKHHPFCDKFQNPSLDIAALNCTIVRLSRSGDLVSACQAFNEMPLRDVISWNSLMSAYLYNEHPESALRIFPEMQSLGFKPTPTSFSIAISSCATLSALDQGKQIHGLSIKASYSSNVFVGTGLITMYSKCHVSECLPRVFNEINAPNVASWNALISGFVRNNQIDEAHQVFNRMPSQNVISWTALMDGYIEVGKVEAAFELFSAMPAKNPVSWTVMLNGLVSAGNFEKVIELFTEMQRDGVQATGESLASVLNACSSTKSVKKGKKVHAHVIKVGYDIKEVVEASLVSMYVCCLKIDEAKLEFDKMNVKYMKSWNFLICGYIYNNQVDKARSFFDQMGIEDPVVLSSIISGYLSDNRIDEAAEMISKVPEPTLETVTTLMSAFIENGRLDEAEKLFYRMPERDVVAYTALLSGYVKEGLFSNAWKLFKEMPEHNVVSYNVMVAGLIHWGKVMEAYELFCKSHEQDEISWRHMIKGYVQSGFHVEAFSLYHQMILSGILPSESMIATLLTACTSLSLLSCGEQIHVAAIKYGVELCLVVANSLINMYGKCGGVRKVKSIFENMPEHDLVTWNALIYVYAVNGLSMEVMQLFEKMRSMGVKPDRVTFLGILSACSHNGLIHEAWGYFNSMRSDYGMVPEMAHYSCIVDLLCKMGFIEHAEKLVDSMLFEPDCVIWTSLLTGCQFNINIEIAERAATKLLQLNPEDPLPYLHLGRMYQLTGRLDELENLRSKLNRARSSKTPGCSWLT